MATPDQLAIRALLRGDAPALARLRADVAEALAPTCQECGSADTEDNGLPTTSPDFSIRCRACDHRHDPNA